MKKGCSLKKTGQSWWAKKTQEDLKVIEFIHLEILPLTTVPLRPQLVFEVSWFYSSWQAPGQGVGEEIAINTCGLDACFLMSLRLAYSSIAAKRPLKTEGEAKKAYIFMEWYRDSGEGRRYGHDDCYRDI